MQCAVPGKKYYSIADALQGKKMAFHVRFPRRWRSLAENTRTRCVALGRSSGIMMRMHLRFPGPGVVMAFLFFIANGSSKKYPIRGPSSL